MTPHNIQLMNYYTKHTDEIEASYWQHITETFAHRSEDDQQKMFCSIEYFWNHVGKLMSGELSL
jgi:hypothetical protein